jgi:hypothetical protein
VFRDRVVLSLLAFAAIFLLAVIVIGTLDRCSTLPLEEVCKRTWVRFFQGGIDPNQVMAISASITAAFTVVLVMVTAAAWLATDKNAEAAHRSATIADKTLIAAHRPWLSVNVSITSDWVFTDEEGRVEIALLIRNVGSAPATNIEWDAVLVPMTHHLTDAIKKVNTRFTARIEVLKKSDLAREVSFGGTLFPNEAYEQRVSLPLSREDIRNAYGHIAPEIGTPFIAPSVVGSILYRSPIADTWHQTGFAADIKVRDDDGFPSMSLSTVNGTTRHDRLMLFRGFFVGKTN